MYTNFLALGKLEERNWPSSIYLDFLVVQFLTDEVVCVIKWLTAEEWNVISLLEVVC